MTIVTHISRMARILLDFILPPRCAGCARRVQDPASLCPVCWSEINLIAGQSCAICDLPFNHIEASDLGAISAPVCASCLANPPQFDWALTACDYSDKARTLVLALKQSRGLYIANMTAKLMAQKLIIAGRDLAGFVLVPIPLHPKRYRMRRFNQSRLLAESVAKHLALAGINVRVSPTLIKRQRFTQSQAGLSRKGRRRNLEGAFSIIPHQEIDGIKVILIDDVFTTGATLESAAKLLRRAGAMEIGALTFARAEGPR